MASATIPGTPTTTPPWRRVRDALTSVGRQSAKMASAARRRYRRPALVISSFTCADTAAWHTWGTGAGLAVLAGLLLAWEFLGGDE